MRNLYLTGLPGSGKTEVGRLAAKLLGYTFIESLEDILATEFPSACALWDAEGEEGFRFRERVALLRLAHMDSVVVAVSDGALIWENNRVTMNKTGLVVALQRDPSLIRLANDDQPTLREESLEELWEDRRELYAACSRILVNEGTPEEAAATLAEWMKEENDRFAIDWTQYR